MASSIKQCTLSVPSDWDNWYLIIRKMAESGEINLWEYIDTTKEETLPLPVIPPIPGPETVNAATDTLAALTPTKRELYKMKFSVYKETSSYAKSVRQIA